jgi:hypothetical protein
VSAPASAARERLLRPALALAREVAAPLLALRAAVGLAAAVVRPASPG